MKEKTKMPEFVKLTFLVVGLVISAWLLGGNFLLKVDTASAKAMQTPPANSRAWIKIYLASAPLHVTFENSRWTANRTEINKWITTTDGVISADPSGFVSTIASQVNVAPTADHDGRSVDTGNLRDQIKAALAAGQPNKSIAVVTAVCPRLNPNNQAGRYSGRYIDVNLTEQTLYAFDGNSLANQFLVSTGTSIHPTPTGDFSVYGKDSSARMHGPGYYLPNVPYISWFSGDYSIHGTYWHNNFGHPMSHGCVNMSIPDAEWIFNWDSIGTPVYIHY